MTKSESTAVAHTNAVKDIVQASRNAYEAVLQLQSANDVNPGSVFVDDDGRSNPHPQKVAHARLIGYHYQLAKKTYWIKAKDLWQDPVTDESGDEYHAIVPDGTEFSVEKVSPEDPVTVEDIPTTSETISLETLSHRWSFRTATIKYTATSPYRESDELHVEQQRVWLPPKAMQLLFERLDEVAAKIGLKADVQEPSWRSDGPV